MIDGDLKNGNRPAEVLLVEDNEDDVFITQKVFKKLEQDVNLHHVPNGKECMAYLRKEGQYQDRRTPDLILLDLNMPLMDGRQVLAEILDDEDLCQLPVVVLTTSDDRDDLYAMYRLRCSSYITKPVDYAPFRTAIEQLVSYWFNLVVLPPNVFQSGESK